MPIPRHRRYFYPIDWDIISRQVRAGGCCAHCGRPDRQTISCAADGRWFDPALNGWRNGKGRAVKAPAKSVPLKLTFVVLAACHYHDHDPSNVHPDNLRPLCQRCHLRHDAKHHRREARITVRARYAVGDLFEGRYPRF